MLTFIKKLMFSNKTKTLDEIKKNSCLQDTIPKKNNNRIEPLSSAFPSFGSSASSVPPYSAYASLYQAQAAQQQYQQQQYQSASDSVLAYLPPQLNKAYLLKLTQLLSDEESKKIIIALAEFCVNNPGELPIDIETSILQFNIGENS